MILQIFQIKPSTSDAMIAQFSISDGNTFISCAAVGKLRTLMPSDVTVFAENVVLQIEVGK